MTSNREMAEKAKDDVKGSIPSLDTEIKKTKKKGVLSRLWGAIFRLRGDDFEKRLQYISKEETAVLSRISRRSQRWRRMHWNLIIFAVLFEAVAIAYAVMTTRSVYLNRKMRAFRVLPLLLLPALFYLIYFAVKSLTKMFDLKDHKTLEKLRAERQAKIDELKEKTNYYTTQQLIQRYDPDPAAKAAAATVLASKLGADSGLKVYVGDESKDNAPMGKSNDVEVARTSVLRNRKPSLSKADNAQIESMHHAGEENLSHRGFEGADVSQPGPLVVEHHPQAGSSMHDAGGWIPRLAALLVGENPTESYALICGNCRMHNGLARKEDFPYVTYYCPHCHALNRPKQVDGRISGSNSPSVASSIVADTIAPPSVGGSIDGVVSTHHSPVSGSASGNSES